MIIMLNLAAQTSSQFVIHNTHVEWCSFLLVADRRDAAY